MCVCVCVIKNHSKVSKKSTMAEEMKIDIIRKEIIKPSSPNPDHLKHYNLSLLDQLVRPSVYMSAVFFYPKKIDFSTSQTLDNLKTSLSKTLTRFYPLAGRIRGNISVDCEDQGAHFIEARIHVFLSAFLKNLDKHSDNLPLPFLPPKSEILKPISPPLLVMQVTSFKCGSLAVAFYMCHKFGDGGVISRFIKDWASISRCQGSQTLELPILHFNVSSYFPPSISAVHFPANESKRSAVTSKKRVTTRRFIFEASSIADLKARAGGNLRPTRSEAITALIWRCATKASMQNKGFWMHSVMHQLVNIRERVKPPLPENAIGNFVRYFSAQAEEGRVELHDLVNMLRRGIEEFGKKEAKRLGGDDWRLEVFQSWKERTDISTRDDTNLYTCTSLHGFGFYEADFGWGKPIWMNLDTGSSLNNFILLANTRDGGGVEAYVTLSEEDMALFKLDPELLSFAYPSNPYSLLMSEIGVCNQASRL